LAALPNCGNNVLPIFSDNSMIRPYDPTTQIGQNMTFTCNSINNKLYWTFNGGSLPVNAEQKNNHLHIINVQDFNQGKYMCTGDTDKKYWTEVPISFSAASILNIYGNKFYGPLWTQN